LATKQAGWRWLSDFGAINALRSVIKLVFVVLGCFVLSSCGGGTLLPCSSGLLINEVSWQLPSDQIREGKTNIEIYNSGNCVISSNNYLILADNFEPLAIKIKYLNPNELFTFDIPHAAQENISITNDKGSKVDEVNVRYIKKETESYARLPDGGDSFYVIDNKDKSIGNLNHSFSFIKKISSYANFRPRDSSSNAILYFKDQYWIFGGWSNWAHDLWYSVADVWSTSDGRNWKLINSAPPYSQYSSFIVYKNKMFAFGSQSYSSMDGVNWDSNPTKWDQNKRIAEFNGSLYGLIDSRVVRYVDGDGFLTILNDVPWGKNRKEPLFLSFDNKLWVIAGTTEDGDAIITHENDIWNSTDGINWVLVTQQAPWAKRRWLNGFSYDNKLFVVNGNNPNLWPDEFGNVADIWFTQNGREWFQLQTDYMWDARHASFVTTDSRGRILLSSGYGHGGVSRIYNDAWILDFKLFFPKEFGALTLEDTWGGNMDGSGAPPANFNQSNYVFVLTNRKKFSMEDLPKNLTNLIVGNGVNQTLLTSQSKNTSKNTSRNLYLQDFSIINCNIKNKFRFVSTAGSCYDEF
jgi:hypothetical protein